jgi:dTDP-4-amino-4,6-dideoxygalactose transaminase
MIPAAKPIIGRAERRAVDRVLRSGGLAQGPQVAAFEKEFSSHVDGRHSIALNSGTSALHMVFIAAGIKPGDEVIVPSFTFAATANSVALAGATPVFVDVEEDYFNIDASEIEAARNIHENADKTWTLPDLTKILQKRATEW